MRRDILRPILTATLLLATAAAHAAPPAPGDGPIRDEPVLASHIPGVMLTPASALPPAPASAARRDGCEHLLARPASDAARAVAARGWAVTGEARIGGYRAVSFVGRMERGTSGSCLLTLGNVAIFRGSTMVALAWSQPRRHRAIASIVQRGPQDARLWDGDFLSQPVADLAVGGRGALTLTPLAAQDPACGDTAVVPNLYGIPIAKARTLLARHGWKPVSRPPASGPIDYAIADIVRAGLIEVEDCSGTGFGYCRFAYAGPAGSIAVTTAGEGDRPVSDYSVQCRPRRPE